MAKIALITGISGQDGSYLAEYLLSKGYQVHGIIRRVALEDETHRLWRIRKIKNKIKLHGASLESYASLVKIINKVKPHELYHLGAQSYVSYSFDDGAGNSAESLTRTVTVVDTTPPVITMGEFAGGTDFVRLFENQQYSY